MRKQLDAYYTPEMAIKELERSMGGNLERHHRYFDPCVGTGNIPKGFSRIPLANWKTGDIGWSVKPDIVGDATKHGLWSDLMRSNHDLTPDWVITNPPFNGAFDILKHAMEYSENGVALLLRLSFLEPTYERGEWLAQHPPNRLIVLPRISFTGDGKTDSVTCAWMVWEHYMTGKQNYIEVVKKEAKCGK